MIYDHYETENEEKTTCLKCHFGGIFRKSHFVQDDHRNKGVHVFVLLVARALPEDALDALSRGQRAALKAHHLSLKKNI